MFVLAVGEWRLLHTQFAPAIFFVNVELLTKSCLVDVILSASRARINVILCSTILKLFHWSLYNRDNFERKNIFLGIMWAWVGTEPKTNNALLTSVTDKRFGAGLQLVHFARLLSIDYLRWFRTCHFLSFTFYCIPFHCFSSPQHGNLFKVFLPKSYTFKSCRLFLFVWYSTE